MAKLFTEKSLLKRLLLLTLTLTLLLSTLTIGVWADEDYEVVKIEAKTVVVTSVTNIRSYPSEDFDCIISGEIALKGKEFTAVGEVWNTDENGSEVLVCYQIDYTVEGYDGKCFILASKVEEVVDSSDGTGDPSEEDEPNEGDSDGSDDNNVPTNVVGGNEGEGTGDGGDDSNGSEEQSNEDNSEGDGTPSGTETKTDSSVNSGTVVLIIVCVVLAAATIALLVLYAKSKTSPKVVEVAKNPKEYLSVPQVGKLHNQGARSAQQDSFTVSPADAASSMGVLAIVADGMGGLEDGDKVSQKAVETALNTFIANAGEKYEALMWKMVVETNKAVNKMLGASKIGKCGSTMVAGLIRQGKFMWFSIGDSRIYLWRDGSLIQLNREHIYRHDLELKVANGSGTLDAAFGAKDGSGLTSFFGRGELTHVDMPAEPLDIHGGDRYILMSDGVYNALSYEELVSCIATTNTAEETAEALGKAVAAKAYSNQDNYTAVVLEV